jgi:phosphate uptake regulator
MFLSILCLGTMAHAQPVNSQNCKDIAKKMMHDDIKIKKIQRQMTNAIGVVSSEANGQESQTYPRIDRFNRHVNILIHNLGSRVGSMKGLIRDAKQQGNSCQEMARKISEKVNAMQEIYVKMGLSLENPDTSGRKLFDLNKSLEQQSNRTNSELQSAVKSF